MDGKRRGRSKGQQRRGEGGQRGSNEKEGEIKGAATKRK
jgi:hypothetical protein